ncbi:hypothetical protein PV327_009953 [Microctonus hyperodae]|uniref:F-box domain-containing protein n=1 Tax=Microctonus hyperodae TaxID=165561 RepID=A0AA39F216_MICHY|nr:hypothetical protein PV327_009953 [Microctonus hyperodae]
MDSLLDALPNLPVDFADILPVEISQMIFEHLDGRSVLNAANVSRKWRDICRGYPRLKQIARDRIREDRRREIKLKRSKRPYESAEIAEKYKKTSESRVATSPPMPITSDELKFISGTEGPGVNPPVEQNPKSRQILIPKRSINRCKRTKQQIELVKAAPE